MVTQRFDHGSAAEALAPRCSCRYAVLVLENGVPTDVGTVLELVGKAVFALKLDYK